jgi:hypothetical protein
MLVHTLCLLCCRETHQATNPLFSQPAEQSFTARPGYTMRHLEEESAL